MKKLTHRTGLTCLALLTGLAFAVSGARAETLFSTDVDSRMIVAFNAADAAVADTLPEGWTAAPFGGGPLAGADILMVFIDRHQYLDPEGKPKHDGRFRGVAMAVPAKAEGSDKLVFFVTHVYLSNGDINPYKNTVGSEVTRQVALTGAGSGPAAARESWSIAASTGGEIALSVAYQSGVPSRSEGESEVHSNVDPDFYRIYRYAQFVDLIHSVPAKVDRVDSLALDISIPELQPVFDGSEELVGIIALPWYARQTFLP
jgi:hypothetical protein